MINTRFIGQEINHLNEAYSSFIKTKSFLEGFVYTQVRENRCTVYGHLNKLYAGVEVTGRDEDLYHQDEYQVMDFTLMDISTNSIDFKDYAELTSTFEKKLATDSNVWMRLKLSHSKIAQAELCFFTNLEK